METKKIKVAIIGRPNVGKSTLFNRLLKQRKSIVDDTPGVTRDRLYADIEWNGKPITLIDTGGLIDEKNIPEKEIIDEVKKHVFVAVFLCRFYLLQEIFFSCLLFFLVSLRFFHHLR